MGHEHSKSKKVKPKDQHVGTSAKEATEDEEYEEHDKKEIEALRKELRNNAELFVLNQLLMSVMFFENYDRDIVEFSTKTLPMEQDLNEKLLATNQKQFLMPDVMFSAVDRNVRYRHEHGPKKGTTEPLVSQRIYVMHDNIEVLDMDGSSQYVSMDGPSYRAYYEESREHKGFVRIKQCKGPSQQSTSEETSSCSEADFVKSSKHNDSGFNTESDYEYGTINKLAMTENLNICEELDRVNRAGKLPKSCLTSVKVKNETGDDTNLFRKDFYFNSYEFMCHFRKIVFPHELCEAMGFSEQKIRQAQYFRDTIYLETYQIIPAIMFPWPGELALDWSMRTRKGSGKYLWPTQHMIGEVSRAHCTVCPNGFLSRNGENAMRSLEWEVFFPHAEKFLEFRMSHAQMKLYLYLVTLFKTFVEPKTASRGLLLRHIKMQVFWECEIDYIRWPEVRLGSKIILVLKRLCSHLGSGFLPDYFIKDKNLVNNVPGICLRTAQDELTKIVEFPVSHFLLALENLIYTTSPRFYPPPDINQLRKILTFAVPGSSSGTQNDSAFKKTTRRKRSREERQEAWNRRLMVQQQKMRKERLRRNDSINTNLTSIDPNEKVSLDGRLIPEKKEQLLTFFIRHFIEIARRSQTMGTTKNTLLYLKQAWYLTVLLDDLGFSEEDVLEYQSNIRHETVACNNRSTTTAVCTVRSLLTFKGKDIDVAKLERSYNEHSVRCEPGLSECSEL